MQKEGSVNRIRLLVGVALTVGVAVSILGAGALKAQDPLKMGTVLHRAALPSGKGMEGILVLREVPPGAEAGKHMQSGTEIAYILEGSFTVEVDGKPPVTLKAGESFHTSAGEVHNVKNASATDPGKALVFYVAKKGTPLEDLSKPAK
jgi:quercetin dioxygenase-like cupin family protein